MELPQFDYTPKASFQQIVERESTCEVRHVTLQDNLTSLVFNFTLADNEFMVLSETYLYVCAKVVLAGNSKEYSKVAPLEYMLNGMIKQAVIEFDGVPATPSANTFAYKAYLESLLMYNRDARQSHLTAAGSFDDVFAKRSATLNGGNEFELMGRVHFDLTHQPRPVPGGRAVCVKLDLNSAPFIFETKEALLRPTLKFTEATLRVRRAHVSAAGMRRIVTPSRRMLRIPYEKSFVRNFPIRVGALEEPLEDVCRGRLPRRLFFCMVSSAAYHGNYATDPFKFEHFNLNSFACFVDGVQYPTQAYRPNTTNGQCVKEYMGLMQTLNQNNTDSYACISYEEFKAKRFILGVNLSPDCFDYEGYNGVTNPPRDGTLRIQVGFSQAAPEAIQGLVYLEFDSEVTFGPDGAVTEADTR